MSEPDNAQIHGSSEESAVWQNIIEGVALAEHFQLSILISDDPDQAQEQLASLPDAVRRARQTAVFVRWLTPYSPDNRSSSYALPDFSAIEAWFSELADEQDPSSRLIIMDLTRAPAEHDQAWERLFQQMNGQRNEIAEMIKSPLILCVPGRLAQSFAYSAPDFWSIRSKQARVDGRPTETPSSSKLERLLAAEPARESSRYDAFLSYSSVDRPWVSVLAQNLERWGVRVNWGQDILVGEPLQDFSKLAESPAAWRILAVSPASMASPWIAMDVMGISAYSLGILKLIPVVLFPALVPPHLSSIQPIDLSNVSRDGYFAKIRQLAAIILNCPESVLKPSKVMLEPPPSLYGDLPGSLWMQAVELFSPLCATKTGRAGLALAISQADGRIVPDILEGYPSSELAASAFLWRTGARDRKSLARVIREYEQDLSRIDDREYTSLLAALTTFPEVTDRATLIEYLQAVEVLCDRDLLGPLFPGVQGRSLVEIYVEPLVSERRLGVNESTARERDTSASPNAAEGNAHTLEELLSRGIAQHWTIIGDPGSGKTTLLVQTALSRARAAMVALNSGELPSLIPAFIGMDAWQRSGKDVVAFLDTQYQRFGIRDAGTAISAMASSGRVLWLIDGLDEAAGEGIEQAARNVAMLARRYPLCQVVATSRRFGYVRPGKDFVELELMPLPPDVQRRLLHKFLSSESVDIVLQTIDAHRSLSGLAANPLFLTLIALVFYGESKVPTQRSVLLREAVNLLLRGGPGRRHTEPMRNDQLALRLLENLALNLMQRGSGPYDGADVQAALLEGPSKELLLRCSDGDAARFLHEVANHTGLLVPEGPHRDTWRFVHRAFQESLAARALARMNEAAWSDLAQFHLHGSGPSGAVPEALGSWAETFALLAGEISEPDSLLRQLMLINPDLGLRALAAAGWVTPETLHELVGLTRRADWEGRREIIESIPTRLGATSDALILLDRLRQATRHGADLYFISQSYRTVETTAEPAVMRLARDLDQRLFGHLPDPPIQFLQRMMLGQRDDEVWRAVGAGEFLIGSPKDDPHRSSSDPELFPVRLSAFQMAAAPVTNAEYELFDPSHKADRAFGDVLPEDELRDHPAVNVSWYEAVCFCRWATDVLRKRGILAPGEVVALPSEAQWEYACRGGTSTSFWSGATEEDLSRVGWFSKNSAQRTHRVCEKPANPWGLCDTHGNVWEWCADAWSNPYAGAGTDPLAAVSDPSRSRTIRGGAWDSTAWQCRSSHRRSAAPSTRAASVGFRIVRCRRNHIQPMES